ncbi:unnamed protein product [Phytophthora fragariaefolia]|uniref:Unnamed protein product n=1 Tax=Phytophthora fragariaefolia TaxID=1490495 RepID=A0A9W6XRP0_9STRA|nr:unnamed protein product [Phytophthora fragariaefolia]
METCFATMLYKHLLIWIEDLLLYADDIETYLDKLTELFSLLNDYRLKLSAKKCSLYPKEVKWCGKIIDANGVPVQDQQHMLLKCMSGRFTGSQLNWAVIEKEAFPIALACDKLDYLPLRPQGFRMFCDHWNFIQVFAPHKHAKRHVKGKLLRWSMKLMNCTNVIEHIAGPHNIWADMISSWANNHAAVPPAIRRIHLTPASSPQQPISEVTEPTISSLRPLDDNNFIWPTFSEIVLVQAKHAATPGAVRTDDNVVYFMPMLQCSLNHIPVPSLSTKAPIELFTGLACPTPLRDFTCLVRTSSEVELVLIEHADDTDCRCACCTCSGGFCRRFCSDDYKLFGCNTRRYFNGDEVKPPPKRRVSLGEYKKARDKTTFACDELQALSDAGSDADIEDGEEDEKTSSSRRENLVFKTR